MATVSDAIQLTLEQKILPTIYEAGWKLDPIYPMLFRSSQGVMRNRGIGRGWIVTKNWVAGLAGGSKFGGVQGGNVVSGPQNFTAYSSMQSFQGVDEVTAPAFLTSTVTLQEQRANFYLPIQILQADRLDSSIGSVLAQNLKGVGKLLTQQEMSVFYATDTTNIALGDIGDTSANVSNVAGDTSAIDVNLGGTSASGRIHRFSQGQMVDLFNSAGTVKRNTNFFVVVDNVDPLAKTLRLRRIDGGELQTTTTLGGGVTYAGAGGDNDVIVIKDSRGVSPGTLNSWIADGSTISSFFGINVNNHGQYKSYVPSAISAALTESLLNTHVGFFYESFPGVELDCAITTNGVLLGFIDNLDGYNSGNANAGRFRYDRNGETLMVNAGWDSFKYRFASRPLEIYTSTYVEPGHLYAGKFKNGGVTRYVPPAVPGAKVDSRFGMEIWFIAALGGAGYQGIFKHAHNSAGQTTDFVECPMIRQWVCMPNQPNFMKLTGITEITGF